MSTKLSKKNIFFAAIGAGIEWFDFIAYVYVAHYIANVFFPDTDSSLALINTFGIFAAAYIFRPIGGIFFANLGDKIGRKTVLILALSLMALSLLIMAVLPTYNDWGIWAIVFLIFARALQGFSVGGEYNAVLVMLLEQAPENKRGFITSLGILVSGGGVLTASLVVLLLTTILGETSMQEYGWRIPFFIGFVLSIGAIIMQFFLKESPHFETVKNNNNTHGFPVIEALKSFPKEIFQVFVLTAYLGVAYYMAAAYLPTYLKDVLSYDFTSAMIVTSISALFYACCGPLFGLLSDKVGRKPLLLVSAILFAIFTYPMYHLMSFHILWLTVILSVLFMINMASITAGFVTTIQELFPTHVRFSGVAIGYNMGNAIFGSTTPLIGTFLIFAFNFPEAPAIYLFVLSLIIIPIILSMKETRWIKLED